MPTGLSKDSKALFKVINAAAAHKEDTIITDLQTQQYKKAAEDVRKDQLGELLEMIGHAVVMIYYVILVLIGSVER